jgi:PAS domain S-box-containing protein
MHVFSRFITNKGRAGHIEGGQSSGDNTELLLYGENSAAAVIIMSLEAEKVGYILHTNDEIYRILGFERKNLIGKKVNALQPKMIAEVHDSFLRKFLETAKRSAINHSLQLFAVTQNGYLRPISLLIKLYP